MAAPPMEAGRHLRPLRNETTSMNPTDDNARGTTDVLPSLYKLQEHVRSAITAATLNRSALSRSYLELAQEHLTTALAALPDR